jgi:pimeloyl-ACP methyl ester carboxylesterase
MQPIRLHNSLTRRVDPLVPIGVLLLIVAGCSPSNSRVVTVNGHELHLECAGGGPTVIFEAGIGGDHSLWPIAERIRDHAYACVYDRPGSGDSPVASDRPTTAHDDVADLHALLRAAHIPLPAIVVGHSYGGLIAWMAAVEHPEDVAGLVLIEASHPRDLERLEAIMTGDQRRTFELGLADPNVDFVASLNQAAADYGSLPDVPLTVIAATHSMNPWCAQGLPCAQMEAIHLELQADYASLRPDGRLVNAATGHTVQDEDPDLVVREILRMVASLR